MGPTKSWCVPLSQIKVLLHHYGPTAEENLLQSLPRSSPQGASFAKSVFLKEKHEISALHLDTCRKVPYVCSPQGWASESSAFTLLSQSKWKVANVSNAVTQPNSRLLPKSKPHLNENSRWECWGKRLTQSLHPPALPLMWARPQGQWGQRGWAPGWSDPHGSQPHREGD